MKTSNKIFISFLIFLFGGITLLFIVSKYYKGDNDETNFAKLEKPLTPFSVVVAEPGANFILKSGKQNKIIQNYLKDTVPNFAPYEVRNDTLFVYAVKQVHSNKQEQSKGGYFIIVPEIFCEKIKSIVAKENSKVRMEDFQADTLSITMNKSRLKWKIDRVAHITIQAKDSDINFYGNNLKMLTVKLDKTKLNAFQNVRIDKLSGSLKNESNCDFTMSNTIRLDADESSNYHFYRYEDFL